MSVKVLCSMGCGADLTKIAKFPRPCYDCNAKLPHPKIMQLSDDEIEAMSA